MILIITILISSNFFEFLKTCFLGMPGEGNEILTHPLQEFIQTGRAMEALKLFSIGALFTTLIIISCLPLLLIALPLIYESVKYYIPVILIAISVHLIFKEKHNLRYALLIYALSGFLGILTLNSPVLNQPLLPLLTGLFGVGLIINNIIQKYEIPSQMKKVIVEADKKDIITGSLAGFASGSLLSLVPAIGPSQSSLVVSEFKNKRKFIISMGGVNAADPLFSLLALYCFDKSRSGALEAIKTLFSISFNDLMLLTTTGVMVAVSSYFLLNKLGIKLSDKLPNMNYKKIGISVLSTIVFLVLILDGWVGLLVLACAGLIGLLAERKKVMRTHAMACLIIPTIMFYLL